jgi:hypothetical protein
MFATLTLRKSVPFSLPEWGAIGGITLGGFVAGLTIFSSTRISHAKAPPRGEQIAFDQVVAPTASLPLDSALTVPTDAIVHGGVAAVVHARGSAIAFIDAKTGRPVGSVGTANDSARSALAVSPADATQWAILDGKRRSVDVVTPKGSRVRSIALPRGAWSSIAWDVSRRHALVTGLVLDGPKSANDGRSIHEFDERGIEVGAHREIAPVRHRLQASFNMPFLALNGSIVLSGSNLSNEVLVFDRSSAAERVVVVANDWFQPIDWVLPRLTTPAKSVAEPTLKWLASQTMLTAVIPLSNGRFVARFTQHSSDRERYVYAVVDSVGRTRALTRATTVKLSSASGDTVSGIDVGADGRASVFVGVVRPD